MKKKDETVKKTGALSKPKKIKMKRSRKQRSKMKMSNEPISTRTIASDSDYCVPWRSNDEWNEICDMFVEEKYELLLPTIKMWQQRVPALPVGVEASFLLVQATIYDERLMEGESQVHWRFDWEEDVLKSMYSLAIIRYLNHISHLASKQIGGGKTTFPLSELASKIDVPDWIVDIRHQASHGVAVPSIELLRLGAEFALNWLKENYWNRKLNETTSMSSVFRLSKNQVAPSDEVALSRIIESYIAAKLYRIQGTIKIHDKEILSVLNSSQPINASVAISSIRKKINQAISHDTKAVCVEIAKGMIPSTQFIQNFLKVHAPKPNTCKSFHQADDRHKHYRILLSLWNPILKVLKQKRLLMKLCYYLVKGMTKVEGEYWFQSFQFHFTSFVIEYLLENYVDEKSPSKEILDIGSVISAYSEPSYLPFHQRVMDLCVPLIGKERVKVLENLINLSDRVQKDMHKESTRLKPLNYEDYESIQEKLSGICNRLKSETWKNIPFGAILTD